MIHHTVELHVLGEDEITPIPRARLLYVASGPFSSGFVNNQEHVDSYSINFLKNY